MNDAQVNELLYQALETELGGVKVYQTAIRCTVNDDLRTEWQGYLDETENHVRIVNDIFSQLDLDPAVETTGRAIVRSKGKALIAAMETALEGGDMTNAQLVAAECVVDAEIKDHANWELIGEVAQELSGDHARVLTGRLRAGGRRRGRASLPHPGLGQRAVVRVAGDDGGAAPAGGAEEGQDRDRGLSCQAVP